MKGKRLLQPISAARPRRLLALAVVAGLALVACLPGPARQALRGSDGPAAAIQVEITPLNTPAFGASAAPMPVATVVATASPQPTAPAATADRATPLAGDFDAQIPVAWFDLAYRLVQDEGWAPPVAARFFGYAGVGLYEAVVPGMPGYQSLAGQLNELTPLPQADPQAGYHWPTVANAALATLFRTFFATASGDSQRAIADLQEQFQDLFSPAVAPDVLQRSVAQGQLVGLAIFQWSQADGYASLNDCPYTAPSGPGLWEPTPPGYAAPLQPCWGQMRPFVLRERSDECQPGMQPVYSEDPTSQFYLEALEVYRTVTDLTPEQQEIARYWSDNPGETGTPPGHSLSVLTQIVRDQKPALDGAAEAYARLGIALGDSFISCWQTKFATGVIRPVTYIRRAFDPLWESPVTTPPFPEYTSGHSVQAGAAAAVLTVLFGDDLAFTDHTHDSLGYAPRSFGSFSEMAQEAAMSRLYGGIHYRSAIEVGLEQGACIGGRVQMLRFRQ